jgi:hypothetical protein
VVEQRAHEGRRGRRLVGERVLEHAGPGVEHALGDGLDQGALRAEVVEDGGARDSRELRDPAIVTFSKPRAANRDRATSRIRSRWLRGPVPRRGRISGMDPSLNPGWTRVQHGIGGRAKGAAGYGVEETFS